MFGALGTVMIAQNLSSDVEASMNLTLGAVLLGLVVGGALGFFVARSAAKGSTPPT
ncbi:MAG: hypothetical protein AB8I08_02675 [Sandaracinaceae bacterium]